MFQKLKERLTGEKSGPPADRVLGLNDIGPDQAAMGQQMRYLLDLHQKGRLNTLRAAVDQMPAREFQAVATHFNRMLSEGPTMNPHADGVLEVVRQRSQMGDIMQAQHIAASQEKAPAAAVPQPKMAIKANEFTPPLN